MAAKMIVEILSKLNFFIWIFYNLGKNGLIFAKMSLKHKKMLNFITIYGKMLYIPKFKMAAILLKMYEYTLEIEFLS